MNFFVNQYLVTKNSSIEHAELKRLALFNGHEPGSAKLLTQDFAPTLDQTLERLLTCSTFLRAPPTTWGRP